MYEYESYSQYLFQDGFLQFQYLIFVGSPCRYGVSKTEIDKRPRGSSLGPDLRALVPPGTTTVFIEFDKFRRGEKELPTCNHTGQSRPTQV